MASRRMISVNSSVRLKRSMLASAAVAAVLALSACSTSEVLNQGYVVDEKSLELVPVGSSREQVLLALGSPSTTATFDNEVFYYISQKRVRPVAFMQPQLVDQKVLAVYFNADGRVERIANYGLQNGQLFDFISRTTTTGGKDKTFLGQILTDTGSGGRGIRL
ncbi:MAG TPA: outer membrane protein assembly factor BamE [Aurantimonas coralicida]|uniref:Outer membrane protein assembly factor BamE n=2 Tax=Aurantimonas TaxID=182269 RepID=A0A9C9NFR2_9HYPH|nr:outer membrane protein assembly factor BamE [Aurantimonas coralicida]HEU01057.1 outer membrane protein assembly factor BamE [Aurantimonas coralicida]